MLLTRPGAARRIVEGVLPSKAEAGGAVRALSRACYLILIGLGLAVTLNGASLGALNGYLDVRGVQTDVDGRKERSLRQEYTGNWSRSFVPNLRARASLRYFRYSIDQPRVENFWTEEVQPSGQVAWSNGPLAWDASARRRATSSQATRGRLLNDNYAMSLRAAYPSWPLLSLRFDSDRLHDKAATRFRDIKETRYLGSASYSKALQQMTYSLTHRRSANRISGVDAVGTRHVARWDLSQTPVVNDRLRVGASYTFTYSSDTSRRLGGGRVIRQIPVAAGLYSDDPTPDQGVLEILPGLANGDTGTPTEPRVDIGGSGEDWNLGADLGFRRPAVGIYLYTDRPSSGAVSWSVYSSENNLDWVLRDAAPGVVFNIALNRYEFIFAAVEARYVKVVKTGLNEVPEVYVTEIEVLEEAAQEGESTTIYRMHMGDLGMIYEATRRLTAGLIGGFQVQPFGGGGNERQLYYYSASASYGRGTRLIHDLRWRQEFERLRSQIGPDRTNRSASYSLLFRALETLDFTASASTMVEDEASRPYQENNAVVVRTRGSPLPSLSFSAEVGNTRNHTYVDRRRSDIRFIRSSVSGEAIPGIDFGLSQSWQEIRTLPVDTTRVRIQYGAELTLRPTGTILLRALVGYADDIAESLNQDYTLNWNMTPKVSIGAQAGLNARDGVIRTERYSASLTYDLSRRITINFSAYHNDFTRVGGSRTTVFQQGVRASF